MYIWGYSRTACFRFTSPCFVFSFREVREWCSIVLCVAVNISLQFVKCAFEIILLHASLFLIPIWSNKSSAHTSVQCCQLFSFYTASVRQNSAHELILGPENIRLPFHSRSWYYVTLTRTRFPPFLISYLYLMLYCYSTSFRFPVFSFYFFIYYHIHFC